ncbi:leucine-rich repeat-containing protein 15 [Lasius niger]|uniref:Leucine-rich repeat-containing protein 15 n=1 Tax=Lasius niger TaxID=67767 RepID=A0A0J7P341_LASNI|nr:leucine-rich repeat-containing protein 15 [Lasius niger]
MALNHKILFFVIIIAHLAKTQRYDFKVPNSEKSKAVSVSQDTGFSVSPPNTEYVTYNPPIPKPNSSPDGRIPPIRPTIFYPPDLSFRFSDVGLQRIGRDFIVSDSIISLSLDNNNISDISPFAFRSMRNLRYLNLSGNKIPRQKLLLLNGNNNLQTLIINDNSDSDVSNAEFLMEHETFQNLEHLQLCNNQLRNFRMPFYIAMHSLSHLHLSNNSISSSSAVFDNIPATLTHLNLNRNLIDRVERDKLRYLQELLMDDNNIIQVCLEDCLEESISLRGADRMQNLSLSRNQIVEVSLDAFNDMKHLLKLDLSGNKIANLAKGTFNKTVFIDDLSLAHNILATIPDVCPMLHLRSLNLTGNHISAVLSDTFCRLQRLENLYLSDNTITTIETRAFNLQSLTYLDLSGNQLKQLPEQWIFSWQILELHLERNNFTELDDLSLINIKSLRNVYLHKNPMPKLKAGSFQSLPGHMSLHLNNVRIECAQCRCNDDDNDRDDDGDDNNGNSHSDYY